MRVKARTSPLPVIATALPARNRRVAAGMAAAGMLPSPARGGLESARRTVWPACDYGLLHAHSGRQVAANRGAHRLHRARKLLLVAGIELGGLCQIAEMHKAGDD